MSKEHEEFLIKFLLDNKDKSYIGKELSVILLEEYSDLSIGNARKIISNACKKNMIKNSHPIKFANNQYAYFTNKNNLEYKNIKNSIRKHKGNLHRVIYALERNGGIIPLFEAKKISGTTELKDTHNANFENILNDLVCLKLAQKCIFKEVEYLVLNSMENTDFLMEKQYKNLINQNLILYLCLSSLIKSNLIDQKQLCYMGQANNFKGIERNGEVWDAFGFSNSVGMGSYDKEYSTLVLIDFFSEHKYEEYDFKGFKKRIERVVFSTKREVRKVLPIVIVKTASPAALKKIKESNYLFFSINGLLSNNAFKISRMYNQNIEVIKNKITKSEINIENELIEPLKEIKKSGNSDVYSNLKGELFEYAMFPVLRRIYSSDCLITHSYTGSVEGKKFECDYFIETPEECIVIELKGYKKDSEIQKGKFNIESKKYDKNTILWFLNQTFSLCKKYHKSRKKYKFCYITTARFSEEARIEMKSRKKNKANNLECLYDRNELINLLTDYGMKNEIKLIKTYYV